MVHDALWNTHTYIYILLKNKIKRLLLLTLTYADTYENCVYKRKVLQNISITHILLEYFGPTRGSNFSHGAEVRRRVLKIIILNHKITIRSRIIILTFNIHFSKNEIMLGMRTVTHAFILVL